MIILMATLPTVSSILEAKWVGSSKGFDFVRLSDSLKELQKSPATKPLMTSGGPRDDQQLPQSFLGLLACSSVWPKVGLLGRG